MDNNDFGGYVSKRRKIPTRDEVFLQFGITDKDKQFSKEGFGLLNRRALIALDHAVLCAHATLNAVINFYREKDKKYYEPVLRELELLRGQILEDSGMRRDADEVLDARIENALTAVGHAGNVFNNTTHLLPKEVRKAVLEARDICDEAIRQPRI